MRAQCWNRRGYVRKAIDDLNRAINIDPKYALAYALRSNLYLDLGCYDKAASDVLAGVQVEPANAEDLINEMLRKSERGLWTELQIKYLGEVDPNDEAGKKLRGPTVIALDESSQAMIGSSSDNEESLDTAESRVRMAEIGYKTAKQQWSKAQVKSTEAAMMRETVLAKDRESLAQSEVLEP